MFEDTPGLTKDEINKLELRILQLLHSCPVKFTICECASLLEAIMETEIPHVKRGTLN